MPATSSGVLRRRAAFFVGISVVLAMLLVACAPPPAPRPIPDTAAKTPQPVLRPRAIAPERTVAPATIATALPAVAPTHDAPAFIQVATGENHSCALLQVGRVQCWGANDDGQLDVPEGVSFQQITAGYRFSCGIRTDGEISCWGRNNHQQLDAPNGQFTAIDAGWDHACALSGTDAICWGWNANDRATAPEDVEFTAIAAGAEHSCGLTLDRRLDLLGKERRRAGGTAKDHFSPGGWHCSTRAYQQRTDHVPGRERCWPVRSARNQYFSTISAGAELWPADSFPPAPCSAGAGVAQSESAPPLAAPPGRFHIDQYRLEKCMRAERRTATRSAGSIHQRSTIRHIFQQYKIRLSDTLELPYHNLTRRILSQALEPQPMEIFDPGQAVAWQWLTETGIY